jgi:hypothetical protein
MIGEKNSMSHWSKCTPLMSACMEHCTKNKIAPLKVTFDVQSGTMACVAPQMQLSSLQQHSGAHGATAGAKNEFSEEHFNTETQHDPAPVEQCMQLALENWMGNFQDIVPK